MNTTKEEIRQIAKEVAEEVLKSGDIVLDMEVDPKEVAKVVEDALNKRITTITSITNTLNARLKALEERVGIDSSKPARIDAIAAAASKPKLRAKLGRKSDEDAVMRAERRAS
jgi:hypothetical protein